MSPSVLARLVSPVTLVVWVIASLITGLSGPFGTFDMYTTEVRFVFWTGVLGFSIASLYVWRSVLVRLIGPGHQVFFDGAMFLGMAVIVSMIALAGRAVLMPWQIAAGHSAMATCGYVVLCIAGGYAFRRLWPGIEDPRYTLAMARVAEPRAVPRPLLSRRLEIPSTTIERLQADGHFIEIVGDTGTQRLRMRFTDAIAEMDPVDGVCSHRSHWVAISAVTGAEKKGNKIFLRMRNGDLVPVSRKYQPDVAARGLLSSLTT